ncbi:hypothetical protein J6W91_01360 [Candidatus Saccharibacteria bacterium]|nr:hypothetical protein [Candidatus Saccharibacteria bacterium]
MDNNQEKNEDFVQYENIQQEMVNDHSAQLESENKEVISKNKKTLLLLLAFFPFTGALGIYSFFTKNNILKVIHGVIDALIVVLLVAGFSPALGCDSGSCVVTMGAVLIVASAPVAFVNYIISIVCTLAIIRKNGGKTSPFVLVSITLSALGVLWMVYNGTCNDLEFINSCYHTLVLSIISFIFALFTKDEKNYILPSIVFVLALAPIVILR